METMVTDDDDSEVTMEMDMGTEETENETVEPSFQKRRNTWPGSLQVPETFSSIYFINLLLLCKF